MLFAGLLLSIFLEYVSPGSFIPIIAAIKIGTIVPLLTFVFAASLSEPISNGRMFGNVTTKWLFFYLFLLAFSVLIADVTLYSWTVFKFALGYVFWYVMIVKLATDVAKLKRLFAVLIFVHILLLGLNPAVILQPETRSYLRGAFFLGDGNDFSLSVCVILPMCLYLLLEASSKIAKGVWLAALGLLILAIIGTQSRGASLALAGSLGFLWWTGKHKVLGVVLLAIVGVVVMAFAPPEYFNRMQTIANYEQEGSAMGRIMAWKSGVRMAAAHPLTGVGSGHFPVALGTEFRPPEFGDQNLPWLTAHSMYFLVIGELGIPGFVCLMALLVGNYRRLNRLRLRARGSPHPEVASFERLFLMLNAALVSFCIGGAFLSVAYYPHIFVLSGIIVAATFAYENKFEELRQHATVNADGATDDRPLTGKNGVKSRSA
ncbi:O-antigen ligase family protein [Woeseia oceani]|uniref:O-antigen ligase-related domain-containing protein n=1 Tax=Woeseia oceani TaxID=1548547 RepID=A0A193LES0_9GAMM|nr:O-antigen ligase family protein [Woeseia oceani]ANO50963.1 hypothetical protein BA177_06850 [Woeseia oceani]